MYTSLMKRLACTFVLFGATGDLARKKVLPALLSLYESKLLPEGFSIIAFSRRQWSDDEYRDFIKTSLKPSHDLEKFLSRIKYVAGNFNDPTAYKKLKERMTEGAKVCGPDSAVLSYFAVPPEHYMDILNGMSGEKLFESLCGSSAPKIMLEKPFGMDESSAINLEKSIESLGFRKDQVIHVDHYLCKTGLIEFVKERELNLEFEKSLNNLQKVKITLLEKIGIEGRVGFYDSVGALRDMVQGHALEVLASVLMSLSGDPQSNRSKVLEALEISDKPIFKQYEDYKKDLGHESETETYVKMFLKYKEVNIEIEVGKMMPEKISRIDLEFNDNTKKSFDLAKSGMDAYELMFLEAVEGDKAYFPSIEEIVASWRIVDKVYKMKS